MRVAVCGAGLDGQRLGIVIKIEKTWARGRVLCLRFSAQYLVQP